MASAREQSAEKNGLFRLYPLEEDSYDASQFQHDIVAIHGLGGHAFKTWTSLDGHLWLRDSLPSYVPKARIMTYGYDSSVAFTSSRAQMIDFAIDLAVTVDLSRGSETERRRPITFICHSLGGVVFKQFLITMSLKGQRYRDLLESISGVMFLGCPHQGSNVATLASTVAKIANITTFGRAIRSDLLKALKRSSLELETIAQQAVCLLQPLTIFSFYEMRLTTQVQVVERLSAVLNLPNETAIPLDGNHREISRFSPSIRSSTTNFVASLSSSFVQNKSLLNSLASLAVRVAQIRPQQPQKDTAQWILVNPKFKAWVSSDEPSILLLTGNPGCGKSVTTRYVADLFADGRFDRTNHSISTVSCFCSYVEGTLNNEAMLLRTVLYKLIQYEPNCGNIVHNRLSTGTITKGSYDLTVDTLWHALYEALSMHSMKDICLIIDAVDELGSDTARSILLGLSRMTKYFQSEQLQSCLKVFISSRNTYSNLHTNYHLISINSTISNKDIERYLIHNIDGFARQNDSFAATLSASWRDAIITRIQRTSNGVFLFATLSWKSFCNTEMWSPEVIQERLELVTSLTSDTKTHYDNILLNRNTTSIPRDVAIVFSILASAAQPLNVVEVETISGMFRSDKRVRQSTDFSRSDNLIQAIEKTYPGLITIHDNGSLAFCHMSFKEYLDSSSILQRFVPFQSYYLVCSCLEYLQMRDLIRDARAGLIRAELVATYPLLQYASTHLFWHMRDVPIGNSLWLLFASTGRKSSIYTMRELLPFSGSSPLQFILDNFEATDMLRLISQLSDDGYDVNEAWSEFTCGRPLQSCCAEGGENYAKERAGFLLLDLGADPNLPRAPWKSNIRRALEGNLLGLYERLLHHPKIDLGNRDRQGRGLLHDLIDVGSIRQLSDAISSLQGVDVNMQDCYGRTPLHVAVLSNRLEKLDLIRNFLRLPGIRLELADLEGRTALGLATYWNMAKEALVLIEHPSALNMPQDSHLSAILAAAKHGNKHLCTQFLERCQYRSIGTYVDASGKGLIHHAAINNWGDMIMQCLSRSRLLIKIDMIDHSSRTALHYAASLGNTESCHELLSSGASLTLQDRNGMTATQAAANSGFKDVLMLLLRTGKVDANQCDHLGRNLVHWIATLDCLEPLHFLSRHDDGIQWTRRDRYGKQPVDIAYICESKRVGQFLSSKGHSSKHYDWDSMYTSPLVDDASQEAPVNQHPGLLGTVFDSPTDQVAVAVAGDEVLGNAEDPASVVVKRQPSPDRSPRRRTVIRNV